METTIRKKVTLKQIEKVFDAPELAYIKFYTPTNKKFKIEEYQGEKINFDITIRHAENENANKIFDNALKKLTK